MQSYQCKVQSICVGMRVWLCQWHEYIQVLEQHKPPSTHLFQGRPCVFQQDNARPHSAHITAAWLHDKIVWVVDWLPAVLKMCGAL